MNKQNRSDSAWKLCPECGVFVRNLRKHLQRNRCKMQHIRGDLRKRLALMKKNVIF